MEPWLEKFARANFRRSADTAHDLKTPLNVAVLNLELLRMRIRKLVQADDEKIGAYTAAIETELRRMGHIFDAFFLLSTPPKNEETPSNVDIAALANDAAVEAGFSLAANGPAMVKAHESRIRQALKMFFESAPKIFREEDRRFAASRDDSTFAIDIAGAPEPAAGFELTKIFKLYYTDPQGNPDLSLAVVRLIAETYGGELNASEDRDKVSLRFKVPLGER
jgi:nitrogen fixation/metabolism regulation signal transduction histidine kinase